MRGLQMDMLKEGAVVTIKVKNVLWPRRHLYTANVRIPEFDVYTGMIVRQKWYDANEIGITSDDGHIKVRRIPRESIVSVNDTVVDYVPVKRGRVEILVTGSRGDTYIVTKENGKATCTCAGFQFRKTCQHAQGVLAA